jgi:hypothetical protein
VFGFLCTDVVRLSLHREYKNTSKSTLLAGQGLSQRLWAVHNVVMSLGAVEIFFILVVVALVVYVLWRLVIRPRR